MTHESTQQLHHRLQVPDVVETIQQHIRRRVTLAQRHLFQAQSPQVHDRWEHLLASCSSNFEPSPTCTHLTEVTHSLRTASTCPVCGVTFVCLHALRTHVGKSHPEHSAAKTGQGYRERSYRHPDLMKHSLDGQPACVHCKKCFASWRPFAGHIVQQACPLLFPPVPSLSASLSNGVPAPETQEMTALAYAPPVLQPSVEQQTVQHLAATQRFSELAASVRREVLLGHCPIFATSVTICPTSPAMPFFSMFLSSKPSLASGASSRFRRSLECTSGHV